MVDNKKQANVNFPLTSIKQTLTAYTITNKSKTKYKKLHMKVINNFASFKLEEEAIKKNKSNFIDIICDKFAMSVN